MTTSEHPRFAQHVRDLGAAFGVQVNFSSKLAPHEGQAVVRMLMGGHWRIDTGERSLDLYPIIDESTYAVAMHELGHALDPLGFIDHHWPPRSSRDMRLRLEQEAHAWKWARQHALEWTPLMRLVMLRGWQSYVVRAAGLGITVPKGGPAAWLRKRTEAK